VTDKSFGKSSRLLNASDYKAVFDDAQLKASNRNILFLAKPNGMSYSRLGLVIAKKNVRLAVQRNRIKRLLRESFRAHHGSQGIDIVVLARRGLDSIENPELHTQFGRLLKELQGKAKRKLTAADSR
jgi:ribonuclease P protein component